ncbi:MAG: S41 family peptidase [Chloroflexi bacterium]|nr:S41 family peptidase [Chloroflexota bacterium]MBL7061956.1 S41 family peptidase [Dehalococcoidia bacterium]
MRIKKAIPLSVVLAVLLFIWPILGAGCDFITKEVVPIITSPETNPLPSNISVSSNADGELPAEFDILSEAWQQLSRDYIDKDKLDPQKLSQGAVRGMMEALDPYSSYADPETHKLWMTSNLEGKFEGIGAVISMKDKQLIVVSPIADSPADRAGIKAGDKILEIDGQPTSKISLTEAVFKIRGPKGSSVKLLVLHEGDSEPVEIQIVRGEITLDSVFSEMRDDIAYIRITQFLKSTGGDLQAALKDAIGKGAKGIVLDLRNNPGGLLNASADVASQFLAMGAVAKVVDAEGMGRMVPVERGGIATHLPLIVLVNGGSASASEIVAGALQDYDRAKLAGSQTFGKGSVQVVRELSDDSALHITSYRWMTPLDRPIDGVGLTPDFALELEDEELVDWAIDYLKSQIKAEPLPVFAS